MPNRRWRIRGPRNSSSICGITAKSWTHSDFAPLGMVTSGMDVVDDLYAGYGDMAPSGPGPDATQIQMEGNAYLTRSFPHLDYIKKATVTTSGIVPEK